MAYLVTRCVRLVQDKFGVQCLDSGTKQNLTSALSSLGSVCFSMNYQFQDTRMHGVEKSYGSGSAAGWKLWALTTGSRLIAIDPDRFECVEHIMPCPMNSWPSPQFAQASYGHILAVNNGGGATLFDTRCPSSARTKPIGAIYGTEFDEDSLIEDQRYIAMDD